MFTLGVAEHVCPASTPPCCVTENPRKASGPSSPNPNPIFSLPAPLSPPLPVIVVRNEGASEASPAPWARTSRRNATLRTSSLSKAFSFHPPFQWLLKPNSQPACAGLTNHKVTESGIEWRAEGMQRALKQTQPQQIGIQVRVLLLLPHSAFSMARSHHTSVLTHPWEVICRPKPSAAAVGGSQPSRENGSQDLTQCRAGSSCDTVF